jgi:hypothetical protein
VLMRTDKLWFSRRVSSSVVFAFLDFRFHRAFQYESEVCHSALRLACTVLFQPFCIHPRLFTVLFGFQPHPLPHTHTDTPTVCTPKALPVCARIFSHTPADRGITACFLSFSFAFRRVPSLARNSWPISLVGYKSGMKTPRFTRLCSSPPSRSPSSRSQPPYSVIAWCVCMLLLFCLLDCSFM